MDASEMRYLEDEDSPVMKTIKGAAHRRRNVALLGLIRTLKMCGNYGLTFAAVGGLYIGVEQLRDFINGAVGAFVAGATVHGLKGRSIPIAISAGSALAFTSAVLDIGVRTTRVDNGQECFPYTTQKRSTAD
ncbi:hypothetical protein C4D60_Mb04t01450 [Musa balbisiana]|uniref:Uncharacterized protein n=1 Tax=Musa balbisiana TaxID=52838 RepID=A0A4S8K8V0_MUSBA|nr:hypothetical protein C4D60_Mb04t01450 [Musa balbisiana]